jgi:CRP/FNR family cyclic AMP-dependent transcriptional regulator
MKFEGVLKQADIFHGLSSEQIAKVAEICSEKRYGFAEIIFEEKSSSDELYIIARGEVEILIDPAWVSGQRGTPIQPTTIATLRRGQCFGEIALVDQGVRSASARSANPETSLVIIAREKLMHLCETDPQFGFLLMHNLATDLALKIRNSGMLMREKLFYARGTNDIDSNESEA